VKYYKIKSLFSVIMTKILNKSHITIAIFDCKIKNVYLRKII